MTKIKIGCCGFGGSMPSYYEQFDVVEVQNTFYDPPKIATLEKWRAAAPRGFEFTLKAWQVITHEASSPTYKRVKRELSDTAREQCGAFKFNRTTKDAWELTKECAEALKAKRILFQCPASFKPIPKNLANMRRFFSSLDRAPNMVLFWEPRGKWDPELISQLCDELDLLHAVDPFVNQTVTPKQSYFRLHGKSGWRYIYSDDELVELRTQLPKNGIAYVLFNNVSMRQDAIKFQRLIADR